MGDDTPAQDCGGCGTAIGEAVRHVLDSGDPVALRAALLTEATARRRAECLANIQTEITKYTLDLLVRVPSAAAVSSVASGLVLNRRCSTMLSGQAIQVPKRSLFW